MTVTFKLISKRLWPSSGDYSKLMTMRFDSWEHYQEFIRDLEGLMDLEGPIQFVSVTGVSNHDPSGSTKEARIENDPSPEHEREERPRRPSGELRQDRSQVQAPPPRES